MTQGVPVGYLWASIAVAGGVTLLLRAFPFLFLGHGRRPPRIVVCLGKVLSPAAIAMLVVYCLGCCTGDRISSAHCWGAAEAAASALVVGLQLWKRNPLLSILAGTVLYMVLVQGVIR